MSTAHYRSTDLADRIEALLAEPNQPRNDALKFSFEVIEPAPVFQRTLTSAAELCGRW